MDPPTELGSATAEQSRLAQCVGHATLVEQVETNKTSIQANEVSS